VKGSPLSSNAGRGGGTFRKTMEVLRHVAGIEAGASFPELIDDLALPKSTLHRLLADLLQQGMLRLDEDRRYRLGYGAFELARLAWDRVDIRPQAEPVIADLVERTGETVHLAVLDGFEVVYIDKVEGSHTFRMASMVGARNPAYCTGVGKALIAYLDPDDLKERIGPRKLTPFTPNTITTLPALLAELARIRERGHAFDDEEHEVGIRCAAAVIFNFRGAPVASLSITAPTIRCDSDRLAALGELVSAAADEITRRCGGRSRAAEHHG
jgi:DNA-binding IclR family transcriptional regulator